MNDIGGARIQRRQGLRGGVIAALCLLAMGLNNVHASAQVIEPHAYGGAYPSGSFDGTGSVGGIAPFPLGMHDMSVFQETGEVFVGNESAGRIYKFSPAGVPLEFSGLAPSTAIVQAVNNFGDVAVDNSSTATKGRIYGFPENGPVRAYEPTGLPAPNFPISLSGACGGDVAPDGSLWIASYSQNKVIQYDSITAIATGSSFSTPFPCDLSIDSQSNFYVVQEGASIVRKYDSAGVLQGIFDGTGAPEPEVAIDRSNDHVYVNHRTYILEFSPAGAELDKFGMAGGSYPGLIGSRGIAVRQSDHMVYAANEIGQPRVDTFASTGQITIPSVITSPPESAAISATLRGVVNADGIDTTECRFEWSEGPGGDYDNSSPCLEGGVPTDVFAAASGDHVVTAAIGGLNKGSTYHFRIVAKNGNNILSRGADVSFQAAGKPAIVMATASHINTDGAALDVTVDPEGGITKYQIQWGLEAPAYGNVVPAAEQALTSNAQAQSVTHVLGGLTPGTTYHFRVIAKNDGGTVISDDREFTTYRPDSGIDSCSNSQVRQQTGSSLVPDCRAYELASAANSGGYDVESDLVPGQAPLHAYPRAEDHLLYSIHVGLIPGIAGSPTNLGPDPYVATRGIDGWSTRYVGLPADGMADEGAFGSPLLGADSSLETFAFGGPEICDPCFDDGSINVPVRSPDGTLIKGMAGTTNPVADPTGTVRKALSADGSHFVFGADQKFEAAGAEGAVSIYDRDLDASTTQVVSTLSNGQTMGGEVGELDISEDGSRIIVGQKISTDVQGNDYWHLYMHIGGSPNTVNLNQGAMAGAVYSGMSGDGSRVFFTTQDKLLGGDTDASADIYEAMVDSAGVLTLRLVSTEAGTPVNDDGCNPSGAPDSWNAVSGAGQCNVVAFAGGAGVSAGDGTLYFLSPERLDGASNGIQDEPNLYVVEPDEVPRFVTTLEPTNRSLANGVRNSEIFSYGDFQVTPSGRFAIFSTKRAVTEFPTIGFEGVYRYDSSTKALDCASCAPTGAVPSSDTALQRSGSALTDDGRVFFSTRESLVLRDTNERQDAYEWSGGAVGLISTGSGPSDSGLMTVSADGVNVFFYTREKLSPEDQNGSAIRVYVAREDGGFPFDQRHPPCAASDECHGPGTEAPGPPNINSQTGSGQPSGSPAQIAKCRKGKVRRKSRCVKKPKRRHSTARKRG